MSCKKWSLSCLNAFIRDSVCYMEKEICLHGITAFRLYEQWDRIVPDLFDKPRARSLRSCRLPHVIEMSDRLAKLGIHDGPYHLMVGNRRYEHEASGVITHVCTRQLPARSLIRVAPGVLCPSPELCFLQLAQMACLEGAGKRDGNAGRSFCRFPWLDEVDLALLGFELCGTYLRDEDGLDNIRNTERPLTSRVKISALLTALPGYPGIGLARRSLELVQDGSHSLMETAMALQLTGPRRVGGMGLPKGELNCQIVTTRGDRWVDLGWKDLRVGVEYQGRLWHTDAERDDRRRNRIVGAGMNLFIVRFDDLRSKDLFDDLVSDLSRALGYRVRIRSQDHRARQMALWTRVLPPARSDEGKYVSNQSACGWGRPYCP